MLTQGEGWRIRVLESSMHRGEAGRMNKKQLSAVLCRIISFQNGTHLAFELRNYASIERSSKM